VRTTLDIDDDVLQALKEIAEVQHRTAGQVLSDLARRALTAQVPEDTAVRNGFRLLPKRGAVITSELVEKLAENE
jgi:predicted transcriptional regulator